MALFQQPATPDQSVGVASGAVGLGMRSRQASACGAVTKARTPAAVSSRPRPDAPWESRRAGRRSPEREHRNRRHDDGGRAREIEARDRGVPHHGAEIRQHRSLQGQQRQPGTERGERGRRATEREPHHGEHEAAVHVARARQHRRRHTDQSHAARPDARAASRVASRGSATPRSPRRAGGHRAPARARPATPRSIRSGARSDDVRDPPRRRSAHRPARPADRAPPRWRSSDWCRRRRERTPPPYRAHRRAPSAARTAGDQDAELPARHQHDHRQHRREEAGHRRHQRAGRPACW